MKIYFYAAASKTVFSHKTYVGNVVEQRTYAVTP